MGDNSNDEEQLSSINIFGEGPIDSIIAMDWNDSRLEFSGGQAPSTSGVGRVTNTIGRDGSNDDFLTDNLGVQIYPNGGRNTAMEGFSSKWSSNGANRTLPDTVHGYLNIKYDAEKRVSDFVQRLFAIGKGKLIKTIESATTLSSSNVYSNNPAEVLLDYMTNTTYGAGILLSDMSLNTFYDFKLYCNELVDYTQVTRRWLNGRLFTLGQVVNYDGKTYTSLKAQNGAQPSGATDGNWTLTSSSETGTVTASAKRFTTNGVASTGDNIGKNLQYLVGGCNGVINYNNGRWGVITKKEALKTPDIFIIGRQYVIKSITGTTQSSWNTVVGTTGVTYSNGDVITAVAVGAGTGTADEIAALFSEDNMIGKFSVSGTALDELVNKLTVKYTSPNDFSQTSQILIDTQNADGEYYISSNANKFTPVVEKTRSIPFTNNSIEAKRVGVQLINETNQSIQATLQTHFRYMDVEAGDRVAIRHRTPGWGYNADQTEETAPKLFTVHTIAEKSRAGGITLQMSLVEYASEIFTEDSMILEDDPAPNTGFRQFNTTPDIGTVTISEASENVNGGPNMGVKISFTDTDPFLRSVEVRYSETSSSVWLDGGISFTDSARISELDELTSYKVEYRIISDIGNRTTWLDGGTQTTIAIIAVPGVVPLSVTSLAVADTLYDLTPSSGIKSRADITWVQPTDSTIVETEHYIVRYKKFS